MAPVKKSKELAHSGDVITDLSVAYDKYARVDPETGEVMDSTDGFVLDDESKVIWFTKKLSDWALAEQAIQTQMQGMIDHYQSKIAQLKKKSASFERHFGPQAEEFAKANLTGKSKTYSTPFASLSFRTTNPKLVVDQAAAAVDYLNIWAEGRGVEKEVKFKVMLSQIDPETKATLLADSATAASAGFIVVPGGESFKIKVAGLGKSGDDDDNG